MNKQTILAGTYTDTGSKGIYAFDFENGVMDNVRVFAEIDSPKYIDVCDGLTASIGKFDNGCGAAVFDREGNLLDQIAWEAKTSCYITWHNGKIYTANYHLGTVACLSFEDHHLKMEKLVEVQNEAGCHQVLFHQDMILVPALHLDRILLFSDALDYRGSINFPQGTGPRHCLFSKDESTLYVLSELSNELYTLNTDGWKLRTVIPVLPSGDTYLRGGAALRFGPDEKFIYASTRKQDVISVIDAEKQKVLQGAYCGGKHPRDFILVDGYLLSANRYSDTVVAFKLNENGLVGSETSRINIPQAVSLAVLK